MSEQAAATSVRAFGYTDVGQRSHNEDCFLVNVDTGLFAVADGVGGHQGGEVASAITCQVLEREANAGSSLEHGIKVANVEVFEAVAQELGRAGMASTVVAAKFDGPVWKLAWVGDSRAYLWDGQLGLLSRDHSLVESLVRTGQITLEEARRHPKKNVIDQAIGLQGENNLRIGINSGVMQPGQTLLLCSDGLNDVLDSAEISLILSSGGSLEDRCKLLVYSAVNGGGSDNATVILVEIDSTITARGDTAPTKFNWRYDPATKTYSGLPKLKRKPEVKSSQPETLDGTQLIKVPVIEEPAASSAGSGKRGADLTHYVLAAVAIVVVGLLVWQVL
ncbi:MAG: protein phosphatase 2C domain-containing protein [Halioglobus sp.]